MEIYRTNAIDSETLGITAPKPSRARTIGVIVFSVIVHVGLLGVAFVTREPPARETTAVVSVLTGHVDESTGAFEATGLRSARIRR